MRSAILVLLTAVLAAADAPAAGDHGLSLHLEPGGKAVLVNAGIAAVTVVGHGSPVYRRESWDGTAWQPVLQFWCGTGMGEHALAAGDEIAFHADRPQDASRWRVTVSVTQGERRIELVSNPVDVDASNAVR